MHQRRFLVTLGFSTLFGLMAFTPPLRAAEQNPQLEVGSARPAHELGAAVAATVANSVYVPVRFAMTVGAAVFGGCVALINGGDAEAAAAIWENADGEAFITPSMIEQRRWPRFGRAR